ncbi:polyprenol phosphomannose-dependent alpha 1,6 mannosyltransferase MptB [Amycolatopsis minnesotensis]|uniref:Polyprenol phosphomannose-dependent alpha 1,6 mannosyltransferase MptB n=1 Tax=Amycolatopsis minnesotensis TaxID=337894 RepID=A0ABP5DZR9_9PSEU
MRRGDQPRWLGFCGSALLATATVAGSLGTPRWFTGSAALPLAVGVGGMGLVVLAWALLGRLVLASGDIAPGPRALRSTFLLWAAPLLVVPPLFSGDAHSYLAQGEIAARGLDPYAVGPNEGLGAAAKLTQSVSGYWRDAPSPYGPLFSGIQRLIAQLAGEQQAAAILLHRLIALAGVALLLWAVPRLAARAGVSAGVPLWLGVLNPLVLWHFVAGVHNDALMLGLMAAGTAIALSAVDETVQWWRLSLGVVVIALGADVKVPAVVALAVVGTALARRMGGRLWHLVLAGGAMVAAVAVVSAVVSAITGLGFGWLGTLGTSSQLNSWMAPTNWLGFLGGGIGSLFGLHLTQPTIGAGRIIGYAVIVCGLAVLIHRQLRGRIGDLQALGLMFAVVVVFGPVVQPWYLLWAVVPLAVCLPACRARTVLIGLVGVFAVLLPPLGGEAGELVLGYLGGLLILAVAAFAAHRSQPFRLAGPEPSRELQETRSARG